jgi:hypothetical protein
VRTAARADANQDAIVAALRLEGYIVWNIRWPVDLLVGTGTAWLPMEVKDGAKPPSARKLTEDQEAFFFAGGGPTAVVTDVESALRAARALRE